MPTLYYHVERRQVRVYNAITGRLCIGHVIIYRNPTATRGPVTQLLPGTWTKAVAQRIARHMNNPAGYPF